eukprot:COSAG05_NODE_1684_length_4282_cov_3.736314_3_plen_130_part_00
MRRRRPRRCLYGYRCSKVVLPLGRAVLCAAGEMGRRRGSGVATLKFVQLLMSAIQVTVLSVLQQNCLPKEHSSRQCETERETRVLQKMLLQRTSVGVFSLARSDGCESKSSRVEESGGTILLFIVLLQL